MRKSRLLFSFLGIALLLALLGGLAAPVSAVVFDQDGMIKADEVIDDDVFISAETVTVDGTVNGILFATGAKVIINGKINGDVFAAGSDVIIGEKAVITGSLFLGGQMVMVNGKATGSMFAGASSIELGTKGEVGRNLFCGGFGTTLQKGSKVGRDALVGGYQAIANGEINRDLMLGAAAVEINGSVTRNVKADIGEVNPSEDISWMKYMRWPGMPTEILAPGLRVGSDAKIGGKLSYTSNIEQPVKIQPGGGISFQTPVPPLKETPKPPTLAQRLEPFNWFFDMLRNMATLLILGALGLWLAPKMFERTVDMARAQPLPATWKGLLTIVGGYVLIGLVGVLVLVVGLVFALLSLGGLSSTIFGLGISGVAAAGTLFSLLIGYLSKLVVAVLIGQIIVNRLFRNLPKPQIWALVIGVVIYGILRAIPVLGWLVGLAATLIGVGAMWLLFRAKQREADAATAAAAGSEPPAPVVES